MALLYPVLIHGGGRISPGGEAAIKVCLLLLALLAARGLYMAIRRRTPAEKAAAAEAVVIAFVLVPLVIGVAVPVGIPLLRGRSLAPLDAGAALLLTFGLYPLAFALALGERRRKPEASPLERALERAARLSPARIAELTPPTAAVISGRVSGEILRAPVSGRPCVWFHVSAVDWEADPMRVVHEERSHHTLVVDDGSSVQAGVVLDGALVRSQSPNPLKEQVHAYLQARGLSSSLTLVERTLSDGDHVLVVGSCRPGQGERGPYRSAALVFAAEPGDAQLLVTHERREQLVAEWKERRKLGSSGRTIFWAGVVLTAAAAALMVASLFS